jgi:hypothetical protein
MAERELSDLADTASAAGLSGFMTESFQEAVRNAVIQSETIQGLIISGPYGIEYTYERIPGKVITQADGVPRFAPRFGIFPKPFSSFLYIEGTRNVTISTVSDYLDYGTFTGILKQTLTVVLATLAVAFLTLLIDTILAKKQVEAGPGEKIAAGGLPAFFPPGEKGERAGSGKQEPPGEAFAGPSFGEVSFDIPEPESAAVDSSAPAGPQGLYAPHSNIGWEAYTKDRLAAELHRCAAGEQDLVLIILEMAGEEETYYRLAETAVKFFTLQDLMFEWGSRGISIIIPNIDLERGFSKAEQFRSRALSALPGMFPEKNDLCVGLSSRSGRLIDADRLLLEASQALKKAWEDPVSPIVAFKSDPEKYRAFIRRGN